LRKLNVNGTNRRAINTKGNRIPENIIKKVINILVNSKQFSHNTLVNSVRSASFSLFFCGILRCMAAVNTGVYSRLPEKKQNTCKTYLLKWTRHTYSKIWNLVFKTVSR
jgi:hypothetical protein